MSTTSWCLSGIHDAAQERYVETKALQFKNDLQQFLCGVIDNKIDFQQQKGEIKFNHDTYKEYYGENIISKDYWVNLLEEMDKITKDYLGEHRLINIGDVLQ